MAGVKLEGVGKVFPGGEAAVRDVDLEAEDGELLVIVGPSGSGKSTLLRLVAGLETVTAGRILLGGNDVTGTPPRERDLAMVFQSYALYPHKTVRQNLAFGLRVRGASPERVEERVAEVAGTLEIDELLDRRPAALSGGQRQRVALGRAIARQPRAFLLDEPLSNLDPALRVRTRTELARLQRRLQATVLYVTHDQEEAMTLGHRVAVMRRGRIQQAAPPEELYRRPANRFVAGFIGSPSMNVVRCAVREGMEGPVLVGTTEAGERAGPNAEEGRLTLRGLTPADRRALEAEVGAGSEVDVGVRPHDVEVVAEGDDVAGPVELVESLGSEDRIHVAVPGFGEDTLVAVVPGGSGISAGQRVQLRLRRDRLHLFDPVDGHRIGAE